MKLFKNVNPHAKPFLFFVLLFLAAILIMGLLNGCETTKTLSQKKDDKISAAAADSGTVSKKSTSDSKGSEYGRETIIFQPAVRDCTINHTNIYPAAPSVIYREWGSQKEEKKTDSYDSSWDHKFNLILQAMASKDTKKETSVLNTWQIIALGIGTGMFCAIVIGAFIKSVRK